jgi:hypothetical protein
MSTVKIPDFSRGINYDLLPAELDPGVCSGATTGFRFRNGFAEKWDGIASVLTSSVLAYWLSPYATASTRYAVFGGLAKVYVHDGTTSTEITRYTDGVAIASITRVGTTATLTTTGNHGRTNGDAFTTYGNFPDQYNVTGTLTVTGATTFTYTMASDPGSSATTLGAYSYNATSNFTGAASDKWTGGSLSGVLIANNPVNGLYYWAGDTSIRLRKFPFSNVADVARPFKNFIVQLAPTISGTKYPHRVLWSSAAEPGSLPATFTASDTNDAGAVDLAETPGPLIDCLPLGDVNIVYKTDARYAMQFVGSTDVFRFSRLPGNDGLLARRCVVNTPVGHVYLTADYDVRVHAGGESKSIARGRVARWISENIQLSQIGDSFLCVNEQKNEVWVCFPRSTAAAGTVKDALVWNWIDDTWGRFEFTGTAGGALVYAESGLWPTNLISFASATANATWLLTSASQSKIGFSPQLNNNGTSSGGGYYAENITGTLECLGLHLGDRDTFKTLQRSRWNIDGTAGNTASVYHGSSKTADGTVTYASAATYTIGTTDYADARSTAGRFSAIKLTTTAYPLSVRSIDLDVTGGGKR